MDELVCLQEMAAFEGIDEAFLWEGMGFGAVLLGPEIPTGHVVPVQGLKLPWSPEAVPLL